MINILPIYRIMLFILFILILFIPSTSSAHWPSKYLGADGANCCDGDDCHKIDMRQVKAVEGGYEVEIGGNSIFIPKRAVHISEKGWPLFCQAYQGNECLFLPMVG